MLSKNKIRKDMLNKRLKLDDNCVKNSGQLLLSRLMEIDFIKNRETVFIYVSSKNEVSTAETIDFTLKNNIRVCVPKTLDNGQMEAVEIENINKDLHVGRFGIYEPVYNKDCVISINDIDLALVPGVAFDILGNRIGFGGGYYDKYFSKINDVRNIYKIGICYDFQILDWVPAVENDIKMDCIISIP